MGEDLISESLVLWAERAGDPAPDVYARLFEAVPEAEALFVRDVTGAIRGEMLAIAFQCLLEPEGLYTANLIRAERMNHDGWGVEADAFARFFPVVMAACREALGTAWTAETEAAWRARLARLETLSRA